MQLGKLRSAIRAHKGTINVEVTLDRVPVKIPVQKSGFLNDVLPQFASDKGAETGLIFKDGLVLVQTPVQPMGSNPFNTIDLMDDNDGTVLTIADDLAAPTLDDESEFEDLFG